MRRLLQGKFFPPDYCSQFESCSQENMTVTTYTDEFLLAFLSLWIDYD